MRPRALELMRLRRERNRRATLISMGWSLLTLTVAIGTVLFCRWVAS